MSKALSPWRPFLLVGSKSGQPLSSHDLKLIRSSSSTTKRFRKNAKKFEVKLIQQKSAPITVDEARSLKLAPKTKAWVRESLLLCDDKIVMQARAVIPFKHFYLRQNPFDYLHKKTLGDWLFKLPDMIRSPFIFRKQTRIHASVTSSKLKKKLCYIERRSIFKVKSQKVLLNETFFDEIYPYLK